MFHFLTSIRWVLTNIVLISSVSMISLQCDKKKSVAQCLQGKIVRITCATTVIQVLNVDTLGEDNWKDGSEANNTFNNVFSVANKCDIPETIKTGDVLTFEIGEPVKQDCIVCMMYDSPPKIKLGIININDCKLPE